MNDATKAARETAIGLLQPSQRDLEHGLELHRESLVVESYGFAPRAAIDVRSIEEAARAGASNAEIKGMYEEQSMIGMLDDADQKRAFAEAFETAGVDCIFQNAGEEGNDIEVLLHRLGRYTYAADAMRDVLQRATTPDDIVAAREAGKHCLYLTTNGVPIPRYFRTAEEGLSQIRTFFQLGVRMMHLTYNRRNLIGDGCGETTNGGLSAFGQHVVQEMNRVGIIVDISHSNVQTGLDAANCSKKPLAISHAVCGALSDHCRAKPDELIRAVADTGGTIGICCIPGFLQGRGDIRSFLDHIEHAVKVGGTDHVTIGTDVAVRYQPQVGPAADVDIPPSRRSFQSLWPKGNSHTDPQWSKPEMASSMRWTNWPLFTVGLVQRGYGDEVIRKIIGGNIMRVAREVLNQ